MKLIEEAAQWHKMASVRLAMLAGITAGYLAANPDQMQALLALLPDGPMRTVASVLVGMFVFSLATGARLVKQGE